MEDIWTNIVEMENTWMKILFIFAILVIYGIIIFLINRFNRKTAGSTSTINGLKVIIRFIAILIIILMIFSIVGNSDQLILSISSVSGIIIGFAATEVVGQIVAGLLLVTAKPFDIEDLVQIGSYQGVIEEINLNYTIMKLFDGTHVKIPNKSLLDTKFLNFTLEVDKALQKHQGIEEKQKKIPKITPQKMKWFDRKTFMKLFGDITDNIIETKITRYSFKVELDFSIDPEVVIQKMKEICKKYQPIYNYKPKFAIVDLGWRPKIKIWIFCTNPYLIMSNQNNFITEIAKDLYNKGEEAV
ncbi:mechanosensitive ion channel domain-containing protein [Candidatus Lokiarchaeum ossiferum]|uniref:mechanosensitive ion channel domain-containing protein n=1 Tax=Candidatus Lokiarchaeum ossiferum TaxID=2951803 RepID=UPI00352CE73F